MSQLTRDRINRAKKEAGVSRSLAIDNLNDAIGRIGYRTHNLERHLATVLRAQARLVMCQWLKARLQDGQSRKQIHRALNQKLHQEPSTSSQWGEAEVRAVVYALGLLYPAGASTPEED